MAIFGNLKEIGLLELIPFLAHQSGVLQIQSQGRTLSLELGGRRVRCAAENGRVLSPAQLEERLLGLLGEGGRFEFKRDARPLSQHGCHPIPIDELVLKLATWRDELEHVADKLPLPDTLFTLADASRAYQDPELARFMDQAWGELAEGASARSLAQTLGLPLNRVRYFLYKLRYMGAIQAKPKEKRPQGPPIVERLLSFLKRRLGDPSWSL